jgi:IS30 family transposase
MGECNRFTHPPETIVRRHYKQRKYLSEADVEIVWSQWRAGRPAVAISAMLEQSRSTVARFLERHGGIRPWTPRRSPRVLSLTEREELSRGVAQGESLRAIARRLARAPSSLSREIRRHGGLVHYRAATADIAAWQRAQRPKPCRLATNARLRRLVATKLRGDWSPQQIAAWLVSTYPDDPTLHVSHETIYRTLYVQARGALKKELITHLRRRRRMRRSRAATTRGHGQGQLSDIVSISERPASVEDRAVPGHWEGDLLAGTKTSHIATLVERQSRYVVLVRLPARDTATVVQALARRIQRLPRSLKQSLTWDRGKEMGQHKRFTVATDVQVYFCDPRSPWQRGSNENTNGLLRQYFPKGMDLSTVSQRQLDAVALKLNTRPRQTLSWKTPAHVLATAVASTD